MEAKNETIIIKKGILIATVSLVLVTELTNVPNTVNNQAVVNAATKKVKKNYELINENPKVYARLRNKNTVNQNLENNEQLR